MHRDPPAPQIEFWFGSGAVFDGAPYEQTSYGMAWMGATTHLLRRAGVLRNGSALHGLMRRAYRHNDAVTPDDDLFAEVLSLTMQPEPVALQILRNYVEADAVMAR
jgi:hypothetical protein